MFCAICYLLYNLKNVKNTHGRVLLLVLKVTHLHGCFSRFLNFTNGTKPRHVSHLLLEGSRYSKAWLPIVVARRLHASRQDIKIISLLKTLFYGKISLSPSLIFRRLIFDAIKNMFKIDKLTSEGKYLFEFIKKDKV